MIFLMPSSASANFFVWFKVQVAIDKQRFALVKRAEEMGRLGAMLIPVGRLGQYSELINELFYAVLGLVGSFHGK